MEQAFEVQPVALPVGVSSDDREKRDEKQKIHRESHREKHLSFANESIGTESHGTESHGTESYSTGSRNTDPYSRDDCSYDDADEEACDESENFHSGNNRKVGGKSKATPFCWLCEYQGNRTTNEVIRFIMEGIPHMALDSLITQSKYLLDRVDVGSECSFSQIKTHVTSHMLHPRIKLALQLHDMVKMQQDVSKCCVVDDVEAGGKTINPQAMRVYLTLCTQVAGVYKIGEDKLTFNQASNDK